MMDTIGSCGSFMRNIKNNTSCRFCCVSLISDIANRIFSLPVRVELISQYLCVVSAKQMANQNVRYESFHFVFQIFNIFVFSL